jgi:hypothetical protein
MPSRFAPLMPDIDSPLVVLQKQMWICGPFSGLVDISLKTLFYHISIHLI